MDRNKRIIRTSFIGIAVNVVLVAVKMVIGMATSSIAIILDAVNNLSDALSSVITIVGTKLSGRKPDKKHPYGYGRIEYLTSMLIAVIVLLAGVTSLKESAVKVIHPEPASYTAASLAIIALAVAVKVVCGSYVKKVGREVNAGSLIAAGSEGQFDALVSFATLAAAFISMKTGLSLEGILGVVISGFIIRTGIELMLEALGCIIGERADSSLSKRVKAKIASSYPGVHGAYDLVLHNYGPEQIIGSVHIEVDDGMDARSLHILSRRIMNDIREEFGIILTVGVYATNTTVDEFTPVRELVLREVETNEGILQMHGFYGDAQRKAVMFDIVVSFKADAQQAKADVLRALQAAYPQYRYDITIDTDFSD